MLDTRNQVGLRADSPPWLRFSESQPEVFDELFIKRDYQGVWMSLCSNGWTYGEAKKAINKLIDVNDDLKFEIIARTWSTLPFGDEEKY